MVPWPIVAPIPSTVEVNDLLRRGRLLRCHTLLVNHLLTLQGPFGRRKLLRETLADPVGRDRTEPLEHHWRNMVKWRNMRFSLGYLCVK